MATKTYKCAGCGAIIKEDECLTIGKKHFCDESCIPNPKNTTKMTEEEAEYKKKMIDFWKETYQSPNIPMLIKQSKMMIDENSNIGMNWKILYNVLMYMQMYERPYDARYGVRQLEQYIYPAVKFINRLNKAKRTVLITEKREKREPIRRVIRFKVMDEEGWE